MAVSFGAATVIGIMLGYLAGLGVGGGSLLILWLTFAVGMDTATARAINLMFFIAAAGAVSFFRWKRGTLKLSLLLPGIIAGCCAAALTTWLSGVVDTGLLKKAFGILLIITGIRELCYRPRKLR